MDLCDLDGVPTARSRAGGGGAGAGAGPGRAVVDEDLRLLLERGLAAGGERQRGPLTGMRALMLAVLEDGIRAYLGRQRVPAAEAEQWILSRHRTTPFCFEIVCEMLGLDPGAARGALRKMKAARIPASRVLPRVRNNVRVPGRVCLRGRSGKRRAA